MASIHWTEVFGQKFTRAEAREASDFYEVLVNFDIESNQLFDLFKNESLTVAKRLVLSKIMPLDVMSKMILGETESRIREVIQARIQVGTLETNGGIRVS